MIFDLVLERDEFIALVKIMQNEKVDVADRRAATKWILDQVGVDIAPERGEVCPHYERYSDDNLAGMPMHTDVCHSYGTVCLPGKTCPIRRRCK